jgi:hypothetical protein
MLTIYLQYLIENSTTKAIALVEKIDYMLLQRQIVKTNGKQIEYLVRAKDAISSFHSITGMLIPVIITIYRTTL